MASLELLVSIGERLNETIKPLEAGLADEQSFSAFLKRLGWIVDPASFNIADVKAALPIAANLATVETVFTEMASSQQYLSPGRYLDLVEALRGVVSTLLGVSSSSAPAGIPADVWATFTAETLDMLLVTDWELRRRHLLALLILGGIVEEVEVPAGADPRRVTYTRRTISWDGLGDLLTNPRSLAQNAYGWAQAGQALRFDLLFNRIAQALPLMGLVATSAAPSAALLDAYYSPSSPFRSQAQQLTLGLMQAADKNGTVDISLFLFPIPEAADSSGPPQGLTFGPSVSITGAPTSVYWPFGITLSGTGGQAKYQGARLDLLPSGTTARLGSPSETTVDAKVRLESVAGNPRLLVGSVFSHRLVFDTIALELSMNGDITSPDLVAGLEFPDLRVIVDMTDADQFLGGKISPDGGFLTVNLPMEVFWSSKTGFHLKGGGGIEAQIPLQISVGPFSITALHLQGALDGGTVSLRVGVDGGLAIGPVTGSVQGIGASLKVLTGQSSGLLGKLDFQFGFAAPTGIGIAIDAGSVSGGGFLFFDEPNGRYGGALELSAYDIAIKAFGLIETKVPGVAFSFVIVISAEFTPIQLGFGFTLDGVGGLIGINRTVDSTTLAARVRDGTLDNVLFPHNLIQNAPAIISELASLFPAADAHYTFGPLAKLGWIGLVHGTLGLILELPSKAITIIGNINAILPKPDDAIVILDMDIGGKLDFPKKHFELDATLSPNSKVGAYTASGDMAMRLDWGDNPNFAISLGGFHSQFTPPPGFPSLRRIAVDLGIKGNPSVTLQGFMALTSNTAQIGASLDVYASDYGATLTGSVGFEALFVFSPFSFDARMWGGVHVDFEGVGFGLTLDGRIRGPSPWIIDGEVCVSLWIASACVGIHKQLDGAPAPQTLPLLDPWEGSPVGAALSAQDVPGLKPAIGELTNWAGRLPSGAIIGVTYVQRKDQKQPVDPVGIATFRQKSVPLDYDISRFAGRPPSRPGKLQITSVTAGGANTTSNYVTDFFAPGQYRQMSNDEALAAKAFEQLNAGVELQGKVATVGSLRARPVTYRTLILDTQGNVVPGAGQDHPLPQRHLDGLVGSTSASRLSARLSGRTRFIDITQAPRLTAQIETFSLVLKANLSLVGTATTNIPRSAVAAALDALAGKSTLKRQQYQIIGSYALAAA